MTTKQLALRLGVSQPRITQLEQAEKDGSITLSSLQRAANALDCQLVYALVPRRPLSELIEERATQRAKSIIDATSHSMALEDQRADADNERAQLEQLINELKNSAGSSLWEDQ
jgi:predicted DNA-binding mobile mystery protein A